MNNDLAWLQSRRVARIWKRGGYFEKVRKVQTTLTRILIVLESVSHGLSENSDEISRKFEGFFPHKHRWSPKKKVFAEIESDFRPKSDIQTFFPHKHRWSPKKKKKKKKRSSPKLSPIFRPNSEIQTFQGGCFLMGGGGLFSYGGGGGYFQFFTKNRPQKH